jgi:hypothetical protein
MALRRSVGAFRSLQQGWADSVLLREVGNAAEQSRGASLLSIGRHPDGSMPANLGPFLVLQPAALTCLRDVASSVGAAL